jgi:hypothetical protein
VTRLHPGRGQAPAPRRWFAVALMIASSVAFADEGPLSLRYETNAREVGEGDVFQLDVVLTSKAQQPVEELSLPDFAPFIVVREQRGTSTQINAVNGQRQVTVEQRFTYLLRANEAANSKSAKRRRASVARWRGRRRSRFASSELKRATTGPRQQLALERIRRRHFSRSPSIAVRCGSANSSR